MSHFYTYEDFVGNSPECLNESSEEEVYEEFGRSGEEIYEFGDDNEEEENEYEEFDPSFRRRSLSQGAALPSNKNFIQGLRAKIVAGPKKTKLGSLLKDRQLFSQQVKKLTNFPFNKKGSNESRDIASSNARNPSSGAQSSGSLDRLMKKQGFFESYTLQKSTAKTENNVKKDVSNIIYSSAPPSPQIISYPTKKKQAVYETVGNDFVISSPTTPRSPHNSHQSSTFSLEVNNADYEDTVITFPSNHSKPQIPKKAIDKTIDQTHIDLLMKQIHEKMQAREISKNIVFVPPNQRTEPSVMSPISNKYNDNVYNRLDISR